MKNFVQAGDTITVPAPYDRGSGQGAKVGQIFGVCTGDALSGADVALKTTGIFDLTKAGSQAWTVGALVYWDDTNKRFTKTSTSNTKAGYAVLAALTTDTVGRVRLVPSI